MREPGHDRVGWMRQPASTRLYNGWCMFATRASTSVPSRRRSFRTIALIIGLLAGLVLATASASRPPSASAPAQLVSEINTRTGDLLLTGEHLAVGERLFFSAADERFGIELWVTDGTAAGSRRITDLHWGKENANPRDLVAYNGNLYFRAEVSIGMTVQTYLVRSDGTPQGTIPLVPASAGERDELAVTSGGLFFAGHHAELGYGLLFSDGTRTGTRQIAPLAPSGPITAVGDRVFFNTIAGYDAETGANTYSLWVSDGTAAGTQQIGDQPVLGNAIAHQDHFYFTSGAVDPQLLGDYMNFELWMSDGTPTGTQRIYHHEPPSYPWPPDPRFPQVPIFSEIQRIPAIIDFIWGVTSIGTQLVFSANGDWLVWDGTSIVQLSSQKITQIKGNSTNALAVAVHASGSHDLLITDGTPAGTQVIFSASKIHNIARADNRIYASITAESGERQLVSRDEAGTWQRIPLTIREPEWRWLNIPLFIPLGRTLLFQANDGQHGDEWWRSDGSVAGTHLVADLNTTGVGSNPTYLTPQADQLFFFTEDPFALWRVGDQQTPLLKLIDLERQIEVLQSNSVGEQLFATLYDPNSPEDTESMRLLVSAGTPETTHLFPAPVQSVFGVFDLGGRAYFAHAQESNELWTNDGTPEGSERVAALGSGAFITAMQKQGDQLLISTQGSAPDGAVFVDVWRSSGLDGTTERLKRFTFPSATVVNSSWLRADTSMAYQLVRVNGDYQLLRSDGTSAGTVLEPVHLPLDPQEQAHSGIALKGVVGAVALLDLTDSTGYSLWASDGTAAGTHKLTDLTHWIGRIQTLPGGVIFATQSGLSELWFSDGTAAGTHKLLRLPDSHSIRSMYRIADQVLFFADGDFTGELWVSDGTTAGTRRVQIFPQRQRVSDVQFELAHRNGTLFLNPDTLDYGSELWALPDNIHLFSSTFVGGEPGAVVAIPISIQANHSALNGPLTVILTLDPALQAGGSTPASELTFGTMSYLAEQTQFVTVRLPADAVYGATYTISATLAGAPANDLAADNTLTITVQAAQQLYIPLIR